MADNQIMGNYGKYDTPKGEKEPFESIFFTLEQKIFPFHIAKTCRKNEVISRFWWGNTGKVVLFVQY